MMSAVLPVTLSAVLAITVSSNRHWEGALLSIQRRMTVDDRRSWRCQALHMLYI